MKRKSKFLIPTVASVLSLSLYMSGGASFAATPKSVQLNGAAPMAATHGKMVDHTNRSTKSGLTIALQLRNSDKLDDFIASLNDPSSPNYKHYLTPDQFKAQFGPTDATVENVKNFLTSKGFKVEDVSSNNAFISVNGTTGQMEDAFGVTINNYKNAKGDTYFANAEAPSVPAELAGVITGVEGLNNEAHYTHPKIRKQSPQVKNKPAAVAPRVGSGPAGGYTPAELKGAYDVSPLASAGYTGAGQTVAVMELDGYKATNITQYSNYYGLGSPAPTNVLVDGYSGAAGSGEVEVELDIEVINAIAPKANVIVYEAPNTDKGLIDNYQKIATDNIAKSISVSWGIGEQHAS
ncbi:MAG TPA: protease pro-enzyme activation domain-containing protein, partial [Candidatus Deferrimicrobium sp.]|nr:protease pro-enzyme activation domain-containing protein [Candidatus Deferrimicrobium sp.]